MACGALEPIVTQPELLVEVLKKEHIYSKAGFNIKTPGTVFGHLFGANIGVSQLGGS